MPKQNAHSPDIFNNSDLCHQGCRILFIVNSLKRRGAEQQLFSFVNNLPNILDVSVFSFSSTAEDFPEFFTQERIHMYLNRHQGKYNLLRTWPLMKCVNSVKPHVIVTLGLGAALLLGRIAAILYGTKVVYSQLNTFENFNNLPGKNGDYFDILNNWINYLILKLPGNRVYRFLTNSNQLSERVSTEVARYPVHTLYNGLPVKEIGSLVASSVCGGIFSIAQKKIQGNPTIVQVGALDENKNVRFTLECIEQIREKIPNVRVLVIGDGNQKKSLEDYVLARDLKENVLFTGHMGRKDCICLMKRADVIVLTSHSESFPNVLVEGQALGLAAVTFDIGAANEIVVNGVTGYVVKPGDRNEYACRLTELLSNNDLCRDMGRKGQERVMDLFGMGRKVDRFLGMMYEDIQISNPDSSNCHPIGQ